MNVNADTFGLLKALLKLDEMDRSNIVEHLPPDKVRKAFLLLLREKDGVPAQNAEKGAAQIAVMKEEHDIIEIVSDAEDPEAGTNDQSTTETVAQPIELPMYFHVRDESGHDTLKEFDDLPVHVQSELKRRFVEMWSLTKTRTLDYTKCTLNLTKYIDRPWCIQYLAIRGSRSASIMYGQGGEFRETADDRCINARQPCAHLTKYEDQFIIRLVPLPRACRQGKNWREIGYWVW